MNRWFEELDCRRTPLGELVLQRRRVLALDGADAALDSAVRHARLLP